MFDAGRETEVRVEGGKVYALGRIELGVLEDWFAWLRERVGDPFSGLDRIIDKVDRADALALVREAEAKRDAVAGLDLGHPFVQGHLKTIPGAAELVRLLLRARHPAATREEAFAVLLSLGGRLEGVLTRALGQVPAGNAAGAAPDATAPTGPASTAA